MSVIITGVKEFGAAMSEMIARQNAATFRATAKNLHLLEREIKADLSTGSTPDVSSPPGTPPYLQSGDLRRSIQVEGPHETGGGGGQVEGQVGPTIEYGRIQELGGDTGRSRLPARPYVAPALERLMPAIRETYVAAWRAAMKG